MVWKGAAGKRVGFGVKDRLVYAWYCPAGNTPETPAAFKANVFPAGNPAHCIDDTVNVCYNKRAILAHNDARARHGAPDLTYDRAIAKAAQTQLVEALGSCTGSAAFTGTTRHQRPYKYKDCGENYYQPMNLASDDLMSTDAATQQWLDGNQYWDFNAGGAVPGQTAAANLQANQFRTMIWKGTNIPAGTTHDVGFGFHCGTVLAWYCPNRPTKSNPRETLLNVCRDDGSCADSAYICTKDGYDSCYNEMALAAHNKKRTLHCSGSDFTSDTTMAKALQKMLNDKQE
jgi:hypothetical protein